MDFRSFQDIQQQLVKYEEEIGVLQRQFKKYFLGVMSTNLVYLAMNARKLHYRTTTNTIFFSKGKDGIRIE